MADVEAKPVHWLWPARVPRGCITLIDGDPGVGKSLMTLDVAARESTGRQLPNEPDPVRRLPGAVLLLNAEDDLGHTIRPRLESLGAELSRCYAFDEIVTVEGNRPVMLPEDLPLIEKFVRDHGITLVTLDPFMGFLSGSVDSHKDADIRRVMFGIRKVAERTGAAFVIVRHLNKLGNGNEPLYRGGGSIGIIGAARSALLVAPHPHDPELRVLARIKGNLCAHPDALTFQIVERDGQLTIEWQGVVDKTAAELLTRKSVGPDKEERDAQKVRDAGTKLLLALDRLDRDRKGVSQRKVRDNARISGRDMTCAVTELREQGVIEEIEVTYRCGRGKGRMGTTEGIRRKPVEN